MFKKAITEIDSFGWVPTIFLALLFSGAVYMAYKLYKQWKEK